MQIKGAGRKVGVLFSFAMLLAEVLSGLLFTPLVIRNLGQAEFGLYNLSLSITTCFTILDLGVGNASVRFMSKYRFDGDKDGARIFLGLVISIYLCIIAFITVGYLGILRPNLAIFFGEGLNGNELVLLRGLLDYTIANAVVTLLVTAFDSELLSYERFDISKGFAILRILLRIAFVLVLFSYGFKSIAIVIVNFALTCIFGVISVIIVTRKFGLVPRFRGINKELVASVLGFTLFVFLQNIATQVNAIAGQMVLGASVSASVLGIYSVAVQINQYYQLMGNAVNGVTMPGVVRLVERGAPVEDLEKEMVKVSRIQFMLLGFILSVFMVVGKDFVILWAGANNGGAYYATLVLLFPVSIAWSQLVGSQVLWAKNELREQSYGRLVITGVSILLICLLCDSPDPVLGVAFGTAFGIFAGDVVLAAYLYKKKIGVDLKKYYSGVAKGILPSLLVSVAFGLALSFFISSAVLRFIAVSVVMFLVFAICLYRLGFSEYERRMFNRYVHRRE